MFKAFPHHFRVNQIVLDLLRTIETSTTESAVHRPLGTADKTTDLLITPKVARCRKSHRATPCMIAKNQKNFTPKTCEGDEAENERNSTRIHLAPQKSKHVLLPLCIQSVGADSGGHQPEQARKFPETGIINQACKAADHRPEKMQCQYIPESTADETKASPSCCRNTDRIEGPDDS